MKSSRGVLSLPGIQIVAVSTITGVVVLHAITLLSILDNGRGRVAGSVGMFVY